MHHRSMGQGLCRGRTQGAGFRADWWFPPALDVPTRGTEVSGEQLPSRAGINLSNWNCSAPRIASGALSRQLPEFLPPPAGVRVKRPKKRAQGGPSAAGRSESMRSCRRRRPGREPRYSSSTRPTFRPTRSTGQVGVERRTGAGGFHQSTPGRESQLHSAMCLETGEVEGWMEGNRLRHLHRLPPATAGSTPRTADRDLGQFASASGRRQGLSHHTR